MAWKKSTAYKGQKLSESYWRISEQHFSHTSKTCRVTFSCYADQSARQDNIGNMLDAHHYMFSGDDYETLISAGDIRAATYGLSLSMKDTPTGDLTPDSIPIMQSFFAGAVME